jgi:two-component system chemotaxis response regulator CheB
MMQAEPLPDLSSRGIEAIVLGASAGGLQALLQILQGLPAHFALPLAAVLHLPEDRHSRVAEVFEYRLELKVVEARDKEPILASTLYFAPPGYHLSIERDRSFSLSGEAPVNFSRPSIDVLMGSAADAYGAHLAGVLLTGANFDGAEGLAKIRAQGGLTLVQDPSEAQVPTMPLAAIRRQAAELVLPLADIRALLMQLGARP